MNKSCAIEIPFSGYHLCSCYSLKLLFLLAFMSSEHFATNIFHLTLNANGRTKPFRRYFDLKTFGTPLQKSNIWYSDIKRIIAAMMLMTNKLAIIPLFISSQSNFFAAKTKKKWVVQNILRSYSDTRKSYSGWK